MRYKARELRWLSYAGLAIVFVIAMLIFPVFAPLSWTSTRLKVQITVFFVSVLIFAASGGSYSEKSVLALAAGIIGIPIVVLCDLLAIGLPLYGVVIASIPHELAACHSISALKGACVIASECTAKNNYLLVRGSNSRDIIRFVILNGNKDDEDHMHLNINRVGLDEFLIVSGTQQIGSLMEYDAPIFGCSKELKINPLFSVQH